jgi:hypothetical protein
LLNTPLYRNYTPLIYMAEAKLLEFLSGLNNADRDALVKQGLIDKKQIAAVIKKRKEEEKKKVGGPYSRPDNIPDNIPIGVPVKPPNKIPIGVPVKPDERKQEIKKLMREKYGGYISMEIPENVKEAENLENAVFGARRSPEKWIDELKYFLDSRKRAQEFIVEKGDWMFEGSVWYTYTRQSQFETAGKPKQRIELFKVEKQVFAERLGNNVATRKSRTSLYDLIVDFLNEGGSVKALIINFDLKVYDMKNKVKGTLQIDLTATNGPGAEGKINIQKLSYKICEQAETKIFDKSREACAIDDIAYECKNIAHLSYWTFERLLAYFFPSESPEAKDLAEQIYRLNETVKGMTDADIKEIDPNFETSVKQMREKMVELETTHKTEFEKAIEKQKIKYKVPAMKMLEWTKEAQYVSIHGLNLFGHEVMRHISENAKLTLVGIINNEHWNPIKPETLKRSIAAAGKLRYNQLNWTIDWIQDAVRFCDTIDDALDTTKYTKNQIVALNKKCLFELSNQFIKNNGGFQPIFNPNLADSRYLVAFKHFDDNLNIMYVAAPEYKEKKMTCDKFNLIFTNQSWAVLASEIAETIIGKLPKGFIGPSIREIIKTSTTCPLNVRFDDGDSKSQVPAEAVSIDTVKQYSAIVENMEHEWIHDEFDENIFPFSSQYNHIPVGQYFVDRDFELVPGMPVKSNWKTHNWVREALKLGTLKLDWITLVRPVRRYLPSDTFKPVIKEFYTLGDKTGKLLANHWVGTWGSVSKKETAFGVTNSYLTALAAAKEYDAYFYQIGGLYYCARTKVKQHTRSDWSRWKQVIDHSEIYLARLLLNFSGPNTKILGFNTDAVKLINPVRLPEIKETYSRGDYRKEDSCAITGKVFKEWSEQMTCEYKYVPWKYEQIDKPDWDKSNLITGPPGCGKSVLVKEAVDYYKAQNKRYYLGTYLTCARARLSNEELKLAEAKSLDSLFKSFGGTRDDTKDKIKNPIDEIGQNTDVILVDEISVVPREHWKRIYELKFKYPHVKIQLFGDFKQLPPGEYDDSSWKSNDNARIQYDYSTHSAIAWLVDYRNYIKPIDPEKCRSNAELRSVREYIITHRKLPPLWNDKKINPKARLAICKTPDFRAEATEIKSLKLKLTGEIGEESISRKSVWWVTPKIDNGVRFTVVGAEDSKIILRSELKIEYKVTQKVYFDNFRSCKLETIERLQGIAYREKFNIFEAENMNLNELLCAIGRATKPDDVFLNYEACKNVEYKWWSPDITPKPIIPKQLKSGKLYKLMWESNEKLLYIGQTTKLDINRRLEEHIDKPAGKVRKAIKEYGPPEIFEIESFDYISTRQLDIRERSLIREWVRRNETENLELVILNTHHANSEGVLRHKIPESTTVLSDVDMSKEFEIKDESEYKTPRERFTITYREGGVLKHIRESFGPRSKQSKEEARKKMETERQKLLKMKFGRC